MTGWTEVSTSIALDGSGDVHIAHTVFQGTQGQVWYSTKSGSSWSHELIEASETPFREFERMLDWVAKER